MTSDHYPYSVKLKINGHIIKSPKSNKKNLNMSKANWQLFHDLLCHKAKEYDNNYLHSIDIDELNKLVKDDLIWAANIFIPKFSGNGKKFYQKNYLDL